MVDRFDLEDSLMKVEQISEDLNLIAKMFCDRVVKVTEDEMFNVLIGMSELHKYRCEEVFSIFENMISTGQFTNERKYQVKTSSEQGEYKEALVEMGYTLSEETKDE